MATVSRVHRDPGPNPNMITDGPGPGRFLISLYDEAHCHENVVLDGGADGIRDNTVLTDVGGDFAGILYEGVAKGVETQRAVLMRGPAEVSLRWLRFPGVTNASDGPDAGSDNTAENAAATAALKEDLVEAMRAAGIVVRD